MKKETLTPLLGIMHTRTKEYLEDLGIPLISDNVFELSSKKMPFKKNYVFLKMLDEFTLIVAYDDKLLYKISEPFLEEANDGDDKDEIYESVATEFLNVIACGSMTSYPDFDISNISSPIYTKDSQDIKPQQNDKHLSLEIQTKYGNLLLKCTYTAK